MNEFFNGKLYTALHREMREGRWPLGPPRLLGDSADVISATISLTKINST